MYSIPNSRGILRDEQNTQWAAVNEQLELQSPESISRIRQIFPNTIKKFKHWITDA